MNVELDKLIDDAVKALDTEAINCSLPKGVVITQQDYQEHKDVDKTEHDQLVDDYVGFITDILNDSNMSDVEIVARYRTGNEIEIDRFSKCTDDANPTDLKTNIYIHTVTTLSDSTDTTVHLSNRLNDRINNFMDYVTREPSDD